MSTKKKAAKKTPPTSAKHWSYEALGFTQREPGGSLLAMFVAPVREILEFADVDGLTPTSSGPQRERKEARVQAIAKFVSEASPPNTIPTAVVLAFEVGTTKFQSASGKVGTLTIKSGSVRPATIVDGQHRLYGIYEADPAMEVAVVGLLDADKVERAFQFLVINNKSSKVPATHTKALLAKMQGTSLSTRLKAARLAFDADGVKDIDLVNTDEESPFFQSIDWTTTPPEKRMVQATAVELSLDYLGGLGISEYEDRDIRRAVFLTMWRTIKEEWTSLWKPDSRLLSKIGIICLTRFIADRITSWADNDDLKIEVTNLEQIEEQTQKIIQHMDKRFWTTPWHEKAQGGFDTTQGRERVVAAITQLYRNGKRELAWYSDIDILDRSSVKD